jgi:hypothetical protein
MNTQNDTSKAEGNLPSFMVEDLIKSIMKKLDEMTGPRFVGITYRSKGTGELSRYVINVNTSYFNLTLKSIEMLKAIENGLTGDYRLACSSLLVSYAQSIIAIQTKTAHPDNTRAGTYTVEHDGGLIRTGDLSYELRGILMSKKVLEAGVHKVVQSKALTVAKQELEKNLPRSKFRSFALDFGAFESIRIGGTELEAW